ncbi:hypothetical protein MFUL124B02_32375 [Myxococcus fulvus 124B02]|nr:hypothetical protein MFUL124B02_32375 [Myxococcus fulvus 124B02]
MGTDIIETYQSSDEDSELLSVLWRGLADQDTLWRKLLDVLEALGQLEDTFGTVSGTQKVVLIRDGDVRSEQWPLAELARRYHPARQAGLTTVMPDGWPLPVRAFLFLPPGVERVEVIRFDLPELLEMGPMKLSPAPLPGTSDTGYTRWRTEAAPGDEETPLFLELTGELSELERALTLRVCSRLDFFRPSRFGGEPNGPHALYNLRHLHTVMARLAERTSGQLVPREPLDSGA